MNILEIKNFSKTYKGNKKAVDNLSITVVLETFMALLDTMVQVRVLLSNR